MTRNKKPDEEKTSRFPVARVVPAALLIVFVILGVWIGLVYRSHQNAADALAALPERPTLTANTQTMAGVLDQADQAIATFVSGDTVGELGRLYQANYFFDEAATCYDLAMGLDPGNPQWPYLRGYLLAMKGQGDRAAGYLDRCLSLKPDYVPALLRRAEYHYKGGRSAEAAADYNAALAEERGNEYAHFGLARIALDAGDGDVAEKHLLRAIEANPAFGVAHRLLASVYEQRGDTDKQTQAMKKADAWKRFVPGPDPWIDSLEGQCYHVEKLLTEGYMAEKLQEPARAVRYYERILSIAPENFDANFRLGTLLLMKGEGERAERLFLAALEGDAIDTSRLDVIHSNLGSIYFKRGELEASITAFTRAVETSPELLEALVGLAAALTRAGRSAEAIERCQQALAVAPESFQAHYNWGMALLQLDKPEEAKGHFDDAVRINVNSPSPDYLVGAYYFEKGRVEAATRHLRAAYASAQAGGDQRLTTRIRGMLKELGSEPG